MYFLKIALKNVELGKLVTPGQNIFTLVDIQKVKIVVHVSEMDIAKIETNNTATIVLESLGGETYKGRVTTIGLKADEPTRSFPVEIDQVEIDQPPWGWGGGCFGACSKTPISAAGPRGSPCSGTSLMRAISSVCTAMTAASSRR